MLIRSALVRGSARIVSQARLGRSMGAARGLHQHCGARVGASPLAPHAAVGRARAAQAAGLARSLPGSVAARLFSSAADGNAGAGEAAAAAGGGTDGAGAGGGSVPAQLPFVMDVDASNIEQVMVQSFGVPTILDCHADWCAPCKQLAPILEDLVQRAAGGLRLAKLDVDANKELAAQLRVQSLPTVYGIAGGKVVDQFVGLPAQEQFQGFVDKLVQAGAAAAAAGPPGAPGGAANSDAAADTTSRTPEELVQLGAQALRTGDFVGARSAFDTVIALEESDAEELAARAEREGATGRRAVVKTEEQLKVEELAAAAHACMAQVLLMSGATDEAETYVANFRNQPKWSKYLHTPAVSQPLAIVELYGGAAPETDVDEVEGRLTANPDDLEARFALARHLVLRGKHEEALQEAFSIIRKDKGWEGGKAREFCVNIFDALGDGNPLVTAGRRRLSNLLF